jgi:hypothetical protein
MRSRLLVLSLLAVAAAVALPGTASAASAGHTIYNFSGETFRLAEIRGQDPGKPPKFEIPADAPKVGDVLEPGETQHVELLYTGDNGARLLWRLAGSNTAQTDVGIHISDSARPECNTVSTLACAKAPENIGVLDRKGTERTIGAGSPRDQAQILRAFCRRDRVVPIAFIDQVERNSCDYDYGSRDKSALGDAQPAGRPIVNCGARTKAIASWWARQKVGVTTSTGVESLPRTDVDFIFGKIKVGIPKAWFDDFTFKGRFTRLVQLFDATFVTARPPVIRDTGTYTVRVGNTIWSLKGLTVDTPDTDGKFMFSVRHRDLTAEEKQDCTGDPDGDD